MAQRPRRLGLPIAGIFLITVGALVLLQTLGVLSWGVWWHIWRFWPVLLIIVGVRVALGRRAPFLATGITALLLLSVLGGAAWITYSEDGTQSVSELREPLGNATHLDLNIRFGAGTIALGALPQGSPRLMEAVFRGPSPSGGATYTLNRSGDRVDLVLENINQPFWNPSIKTEWEIRLAQGIEINFLLRSGASDLNVNLEHLRVTDLDIAVGAAEITIVLPGSTEFTSVSIDVGAANLTVIVPQGVAARIDTDTGLASVTIDRSRFPTANGYSQSPDYDTAEYRVDLDIDGGLANIEVR